MSTERDGSPACSRRAVILGFFAILAFLGLVPRSAAQGYGYDREDDPLVLGVKKAIAAAKEDEKKTLAASLEELDWQVLELKEDVKVDMAPVLESARESGSASRVAYALTQLVFQALRQKFHWNLEEELAQASRARARLDAASFYYEEILSHAVRRADKAQKKDRHTEILALFERLRKHCGSSGLFGLGASKPDVESFRTDGERLVALLYEVYPDFLGHPEKERETANGSEDGGAPR